MGYNKKNDNMEQVVENYSWRHKWRVDSEWRLFYYKSSTDVRMLDIDRSWKVFGFDPEYYTKEATLKEIRDGLTSFANANYKKGQFVTSVGGVDSYCLSGVIRCEMHSFGVVVYGVSVDGILVRLFFDGYWAKF